jgi:organic radical activating enzyme
MEHFYTLQGEGFYAGHAAYFIRLGGCDVQCVWCDVKDSWDASKHPSLSVKELVDEALNHPGRMVVITGGEPSVHNMTNLCMALHEKGFRIHIETSGTHALEGSFDWITLSPKKFSFSLAENLPLANELKVVVFNNSDFSWAEKYAQRVNEQCKLYLQPEWDKREEMTPAIISFIQQNPHWQLSLQTHKYINIP